MPLPTCRAPAINAEISTNYKATATKVADKTTTVVEIKLAGEQPATGWTTTLFLPVRCGEGWAITALSAFQSQSLACDRCAALSSMCSPSLPQAGVYTVSVKGSNINGDGAASAESAEFTIGEKATPLLLCFAHLFGAALCPLDRSASRNSWG